MSIYCDAIRRDVLADAIARDTAFYLEEEEKSSRSDGRDKTDAFFELDSESEEYEEDVSDAKKKKKGEFFQFL